MRTRFVSTLPAILLAVMAVVLAVIGLVRYDGSQASVPAPEPQQPERADAATAPRHLYLFANEDILPGTELTPELFREVETSTELPGALGPEQAPFGQILNVVVRAGSPLTEDAVASVTPLQGVVDEGIRAMAFELDPLSSVGGLLHPGDLVDIIATFRTDSRDIAASVPLISGVEVLAVRGMLDPVVAAREEKQEEQRRNATMVLAIPESEVGRVALAAAEARLRFVATARGVIVSSPGPQQEEVAPEPAGQVPDPVAEAKPVFLADIRPLSPEAKARKAREAAQKAQEKKKDKGLKVQVFEGSEARTVYVR